MNEIAMRYATIRKQNYYIDIRGSVLVLFHGMRSWTAVAPEDGPLLSRDFEFFQLVAVAEEDIQLR